MTFESQILTTLELTFNVERVSPRLNMGIDAILSLRTNSKIKAYAIIAENVNDILLESIIESTNTLVHLNKLAKLPIILFKRDVANVMFGLLSYWDFDRCFINKNIVWREYDISNVNWLVTQISIRRDSVKLLDSHMCRVIKTIYLNDGDIIDGEIKYLRFFGEKYKMKDTSTISEEERMRRLIYGTPEDDYPNDELDKVLYLQVLKTYPNAKIKSDLLLFDSELLDLRLLKEKESHMFYMYFVPIIYDNLGVIQNTSIEDNELKMELYYTPSFFKETKISSISQIVKLDGNNNDFITIIKNYYQPLSAINI